MDDRIETVTGSGDIGEFRCAACGNRILGAAVSFAARPKGHVCLDYCSMACARKALGIEAETAPVPVGCPWSSICRDNASIDCDRTACANYDPRANLPMCPCVFTEPEAEVPELYWDTPQKRGKNIRQALRTLDNAVLVHDAYWPVDAKYAQLFLEAPQTAAKLKAAEAALKRAATGMEMALHCKGHCCNPESRQHMLAALAAIDAALGKEGA